MKSHGRVGWTIAPMLCFNMNSQDRTPRVSTSLDAFSTILSTLVDVSLFVRGCFQCQHQQKQDHTDTWFDIQQTSVDQSLCYVNGEALSSLNINDGVVRIKKRRHKSYLAATLDDPFQQRVIPATHTSSKSQPIYGDTYVSSKTRVVCNNGPQSSFAISVQKEYLGRNEFLRCDGHFKPKLRPLHHKIKRHKITSPVLHRRLMHLDCVEPWDSISLDSINDQDLRLERQKVFGDVWRTCELEDVFQDYNTASYNNYGCVSTAFQKKLATAKNTTEKFEEIFPAKRSNECTSARSSVENTMSPLMIENNHRITVVDSESDCCSVSGLKVTVNCLECEDVVTLIREIVYMNSSDDLQVDSQVLRNRNFDCDTNFIVHKKSFNALLIYDLVKQMMYECRHTYYPSSILLSTALHTETVQYLVLNVIELPLISDLTVAPTPQHLDTVPEYIDKIANEEMKLESRSWHSFDKQELQTKQLVFEQIFDHILTAEAQLLMHLFNKKIERFNFNDA